MSGEFREKPLSLYTLQALNADSNARPLEHKAL